MTAGDPARGFGAHADDYAALRPAYPAALFDFMLDRLDGPRRTCVDLGAGAGLASLAMAAHFERVVAVEPDARMLARLPLRENIEPLNAGAEDAVFEAGSIDATLAATSFHWMDQALMCARIADWLRPGGMFFPFLYGPFEVVGAGRPVWAAHRRLWGRYRDPRLGAKADYSKALVNEPRLSVTGTFSTKIERTYQPGEAAALFATTSYGAAFAAEHGGGDAYAGRLAEEFAAAGPAVEVVFPLGGVLAVKTSD